MRLVRAELVKLRTVRTLLWLTLTMVLFVGIPLVSIAASSGVIDNAADDRSVARVAAVAVVFAVLLGIIVVGAEGTHGTITQTFLVAPVRERVLAAKAVVAGVLGLALGVIAEVLVLVIAVPGASLSVRNAREVLAGVLVACITAGVVGVGIGALFHRQGPAIIVTLVWLLIAESVFTVALTERIKYLPGHVFAAAVGGQDSGQGDLLTAGAGALGTFLYAGLFIGVGGFALSRRDV